MGTYITDREQAEAAAAKAQAELADSTAFYNFIKQQDGDTLVLNCTANLLIFKEYFNGELFTVEALRDSVPALGNKLATDASDRVKEAKLAEYESMLPDDEGNRAAAVARLRYSNINAIQSAIDTLNETRRLTRHSAEEIRAGIAANRASQPKAAGPQLGPEYTREFLKSSKVDATEFKRLVRIYGSQVQDRLNGR
jgi:hypothetical protein